MEERMRYAIAVWSLAIAILMAIPVIPAQPPETLRLSGQPPTPMGGIVDQVQWFTQRDASQALLQLDTNQMDIYAGSLITQAQVQAAHADPAIRTTDSYGWDTDLFVNPVPVNQSLAPGVFNPFAIREIRQAMNYLIDRNYINEEIFGGYGHPHATIWTNVSPEVTRDPFFFRDLNRENEPNYTRAHAMVSDGLNASGATYNVTAWFWHGNPITINVIERVEDRRHLIGQYVSTQLRALGLQVNEVVVNGASALGIVYSGPPDTGAWMLYTEASVSTNLPAWPDGDLAYWDCGGEGSPIWMLYVPPPALQAVCAKLANGNYTSVAERKALVERGAQLALNESVRVWLLADEPFVYSTRVTGRISGFNEGPWNALSIRNALFGTPGCTLRVGDRLFLVSPWQPWEGFTLVYDQIVGSAFMDSGVTTHPYTGEYIPVRAAFQIATAGRNGTLSVPSNATVFNTTTNTWVSVGPGITAASEVTFNYTFGNWHHAVAMNMNDVLYGVSLIARRARGDVAAHDPDAVGAHDRTFDRLFRGLQVENSTTMKIFIDYRHLDPSFIAATADVWPTTPWEVGELAMATVIRDHTRVSQNSASNDGLRVIDLTQGATISFMDNELASGNITTGWRPPGFSGLISSAEAQARWSALQSWRTSYGNYFPSNGPYMLTAVDPVNRQAVLSNFTSYPLAPNHWDSLLSPAVPSLAIAPIANVGIGWKAQVDISTSLGGQPYNNATVWYRIVQPNTTVVLLSRQANRTGPGSWVADLNASFTGNLNPGSYDFEAAAVGREASEAVFANRTFLVVTASDTTPPSSTIAPLPSYWQTKPPTQLQVSVSDDLSGIANVALYAGYSADGSSWTAPSLFATDSSSPYVFNYALGQGDGRYRFWSIATDGAGNAESLASKPSTGELELGYDTTAPISSLSGPMNYWQRTTQFTLTGAASDALSGVGSLELFYSYIVDGTDWSAWVPMATDTVAPYTFAFASTRGDGRYRFWSIAADVAGNTEPAPANTAGGQIELGLDTTAPTNSTTNPVHSASRNSNARTDIRLTFTEAVNQSVAQAAFSIQPSVAGTFQWQGNVLAFTPASDLATGTRVTVTIGSRVSAAARNPLQGGRTFSFTTRNPPRTPPAVLGWLLPIGIGVTIAVAAGLVAWWRVTRRNR